jgi:hypothetical protein
MGNPYPMEFVEEDAAITEPVTWETYWAWELAQELKAYECTLGG